MNKKTLTEQEIRTQYITPAIQSTLPKSTPRREIIEAEQLHMKRLGSRAEGLN